MDGHPIDVEVSVAQGLPAFTIVGLPDVSIQEARERVRSAIAASQEEWPLRRVTVNLSPAHLRKTGSAFDLAMALGVLAASGRIARDRLRGICVLGELSLDGGVRPVRGMLPSAIAAAQHGARALLVPASNAREAALVKGLDIYPVEHLARAVRFLRGEAAIDPWNAPAASSETVALEEDMSDVRGQDEAKRALVVAAAGGHNVVMIGAPGGGKTMLARRLAGILPPMTEAESFEVTRVYSVAGLVPEDRPLITRRPFRAPHHSSSTTGLVGGGSGMPHPGEVSLAHRGVLFMDEFGEFRREALQSLRQPLEDGRVTIVRSKWAVTYPARFQLVAASNPCPCGFHGDDLKPCTCPDLSRMNYTDRLNGPVLDRIDLQIRVGRVTRAELFASGDGASTSEMAARVATARALQRERFRGTSITCNAELPPRALQKRCALDDVAVRTLGRAVDKFALTGRGAHRLMRVARTIADLHGSETTTRDHVVEAMTYRLEIVA